MIITANTSKEEILKLGARCERDNHCCHYSTGFLAEDDLGNIAHHLGITEQKLREQYLREERIFNKTALRPKIVAEGKPYGRCVFLDEQRGCTIHEVKPMQCKVSTCSHLGPDILQWFYLTYFVDASEPESLRQFAQFIKFHQPIPGASMAELVPDKEELRKILAYERFKVKGDE
ncbi:YkgJ family cysteine cluster protein [Candidatus Woesearchaeota archaeon]|nr:YkgJ family cysteine cluster protein [Candidatus Woesearchaeota archaeon]